MELIKMNYKGITLSVNPATIKTEMARSLAKKTAIFSTSRVQDMCFEPTKISGSGYLVGANARCDAHEIIRTFKSKGSAYLFVPGFAPIRAFFSSLSMWTAKAAALITPLNLLRIVLKKRAELILHIPMLPRGKTFTIYQTALM